MLAQTAWIGFTKKSRFTRLRIGVMGALTLAACSLNAWAEPIQNPYLQSRLIGSDQATGALVIQTRRGDSLRVIAQHYSRATNIPFARALEILQKTNEHQFPNGDADKMLVGSQLVLPSKNPTLIAPTTSAEQTSSVTENAKLAPEAIVSDKPSALPSESAQAVVNANSLVGSLNRLEDKLQAQVQDTVIAPYYGKLKAWFLAVPASLWAVIVPTILLVWMVARLTRRSTKSQRSLEKHGVEIPMPPTVTSPIAPTDNIQAEHATAAKTTLIPADVIDGWMNPAQTKHVVVDPMEKPASTDSVQTEQIQVPSELSVRKSNSFVSPNVVSMYAVRLLNPQSAPIGTTQSIKTPLQTSNQPEVETSVGQDFDKLKHVLNGLTADQLDLRSKEPNHQATYSSETRSEKIADVNGLLQHDAERATVKPTELQVHYGAFKERARLQKWMHAFDPDQLLTHAQAAYHAGQSEVAQHILNEILLRGNAAQCTKALDLRNLWLTQKHNTPANETH